MSQAGARNAAHAMFDADVASRALGIELVEAADGRAVARMRITEQMVNGHDIAHGGFVFLLADTAFACACNSHGPVTVAAGADISFVATGRLGDELTARPPSAPATAATASTTSPCTGTTADGPEVVAEFRGRSRTIGRMHHDEHRPPELAPRPGELSDVERLSADELRPLQLERLQWTLRARLRERALLHRPSSTRPACTRTTAGSWPTWRSSRSPPRPTCGTTTRSGCSPCRRTRFGASTPPAAPPASPTVVGYTEQDIDTWADGDGPVDLRRGRPARRTRSTSPTATACSPAASARTTAPRSWAAR